MSEHSGSGERTLYDLTPGESGMILSVGNQSGAVKRRLVDMGLTPGTVVKVTKIAPLGDPLEVSLRGYEMSLRRADAAQIRMGQPRRTERGGTARGAMTRHVTDPETARRQLRDHEHELQEHGGSYDPTAHDTRPMRVALAGNPNCGKTTLFNALTGSNQYVGNWPGVTVEKKEGTARLGDKTLTIVDLPGIYSLSPYSMEEIVARDFIIGEAPDCIIDIVDATNLERNLYLTVQLLELERPTVLALNFMDEVAKRGDQIDVERLSKELGIPVVPITARTGEGLEELLHTAHRQMHLGCTVEPDDLYDAFTHDIHHRMGELLHDYAYAAGLPAHWASIKLLEGDELVERALALPEPVQEQLDRVVAEYESASDLGDRETLVADSRYQYIERVVAASVTKGQKPGELTLSEKVDKVVTGKYLALPLFLCAMLVMFVITFGPFGSWLSNLVAAGIDLWAIVILGLTGQGGDWEEHVLSTAGIINKMKPRHLSAMTFAPAAGTPLGEDVLAGRFQVCTPDQILEECHLLLEHLDVDPLHFTSNHASNYLPLKGGLPEDREKFLSLIDQALEGKIRLRKTLNRGI